VLNHRKQHVNLFALNPGDFKVNIILDWLADIRVDSASMSGDSVSEGVGPALVAGMKREAFVLPSEAIRGMPENRLYPHEVKKMWDNIFRAIGVTSTSDRDSAKVLICTYYIVNSYSSRSNFEKEIDVGSKTFSMRLVADVLAWRTRRFMNDEDNAKICLAIMVNNPELQTAQARRWSVYDQKLAKYCFEGSLVLSDLTHDDRRVIESARYQQILSASDYVRADFSLAGNNDNPSAGPVSSGSGGGAPSSVGVDTSLGRRGKGSGLHDLM